MIDSYEIKPQTEIAVLSRDTTDSTYPIEMVLPLVGMSEYFVSKVLGKHKVLTEGMIISLLDQDAFSETFVPRSKILPFLRKELEKKKDFSATPFQRNCLYQGDAVELIKSLQDKSIQCVVTSTPYWAMRIYDELCIREWADGEICSFGLEQTPEGFIRHSVEILYYLMAKITDDGSVWWNLMDSYNTRTQIRSSAVEALMAMQGHDRRTWREQPYRRYSMGHAYLKDGEQCMIPQKIAERASRMGYYVKSIISWCKTACMPEPQQSRVSRNVEYILHLTVQRTPKFDKTAYLSLPPDIGGKQPFESEKLCDFWHLPTSSGGNGHGAQFPLQIPGRCIALSSSKGDLVLDPFIGSGTTAVAAYQLERDYIGFDIAEQYIELARTRIKESMEKGIQIQLPI